MAEAANRAADDRPSSAGLMPPVSASGLTEINATPAIATTIASAMAAVSGSPRNVRPISATSTGSVFRYATVTTKERCSMVISIRAVPPIWVAAPSKVQSAKSAFMAGNAAWVVASTAARKTSAKGKPNRKRTKVAPSAPSLGVSSRCMALRAVWPAAPSKVKMTQRKFTEGYTVSRSRVGSGVGPGRRYATPFLK